MNSQLREQAVKLRIEKNLSYSEIKKRLSVPQSTLSYWLREFPLTEGRIKELQKMGWEKSEAKIERFRAAMKRREKMKYQEVYNEQQRKLANLSKDSFFVAGLMLYLGEGNKKDKYKIALANTDPLIIKFFVKWLTDFLSIPKEEMKFQLHLYENMDIRHEIKFWINELRLKENQLYRPSIRKLRKSSFSYRESYRHGTCDISVCGREKKRELIAAIQALLDLYSKTIIKGV